MSGISYPRIGVATVRGVEDQVVIWCVNTVGQVSYRTPTPARGWTLHDESDVTDFRPLTLIDHQNCAQVEDLAKFHREVKGNAEFTDEPWSVPGLRMRAALRAYAAKQSDPTPPEPEGDVLVISASGFVWQPLHDGRWKMVDGDLTVPDWASLTRRYGPLRVYRAEG